MESLSCISLNQIKIDDRFWNRYTRSVSEKLLPYQWRVLNDQEPDAEPSRCIRNFRRAAGEEPGGFYGFVFQDSDLAKWLEAAAYSLSAHPDPELVERMEEAIDLIGRAQCQDGYLNTYYTLEAPESRWRNLQQGHELYTAGHMMEAAAACYQVTGNRKLLDIMCRFADLICEVFRQNEFRDAVPGHEEIETGLIRLWKVTGKNSYLDMAREFIKRRGRVPDYFVREQAHPKWISIFREMDASDTLYHQCHKPVREQETAEGHAVRAMYLYRAMAELAAIDRDESMLQACERLYDNITQKRMYLTGGIGSSGFLERFTTDYDLPNASGYSETCASIGLALFCRTMASLIRQAKYADTMELALMNTVLSGISLDGTRFFYVNPLEVWPDNCLDRTSMSHVKPKRQKWFGCACCPPNIARTLASLGEYICFTENDGLWVNLFLSCEIQTAFHGVPVILRMETNYPFEGTVKLHVVPDAPVYGTLALRLPEWSPAFSVTEDGEAVEVQNKDGYLMIQRLWTETPLVYTLDVSPRLVYPDPKLRACAGKTAVMKGPLVYCLEQEDNGENLSGLFLNDRLPLTEEFDSTLLGGVSVIHAKGMRTVEQEGALYRSTPAEEQAVELSFVPYHCWNNRSEGEMMVWVSRW